MLAMVLLAGCDLLTPAPSLPPATELQLDGQVLRASLLNDEYPECEDRMDETGFNIPCTRVEAALGREAICPLRAPFAQLRFGCGRDYENDPREQMAVQARPEGRPLLWAGAHAQFGECGLQATGPVAGMMGHWRTDSGRIACFFDLEGPVSCDSYFRTVEGGHTGIASGLFMTLAAEHETAARVATFALQHSLKSVPHSMVHTAAASSALLAVGWGPDVPWQNQVFDTLAFDTLMLNGPQRSLLDAQVPVLLDMGDIGRRALNAQRHGAMPDE